MDQTVPGPNSQPMRQWTPMHGAPENEAIGQLPDTQPFERKRTC
jgi:hypothetical protein